jgi:hypothetical protein
MSAAPFRHIGYTTEELNNMKESTIAAINALVAADQSPEDVYEFRGHISNIEQQLRYDQQVQLEREQRLKQTSCRT